MLKILGGVVIGVFVGALAFEILHRKSPGLIEEIERKAERVASSFLEAFQDGYRTRTKPTAA